jgi:hypothetical protein
MPHSPPMWDALLPGRRRHADHCKQYK